MRSGNTWVGTDWNAHQSQTFHFSAERVGDTRKVKISWWMTTECNDSAASPTYYICYGNQKLVVNGKTEISWSSPSYTDSSGRTVYRSFTDKGSWLDNNYRNKVFYDTNGDYLGIIRNVKILGTKWTSDSFTLKADDMGKVQFSVSGNFGWDGKANLKFSKTFTVEDVVPPKPLIVDYSANSSGFLSGNNAKKIPDDQTKTRGKDLELSSKVPVAYDSDNEANYTFVCWSTDVVNSFTSKSDAKTYKPSATYKKDKSMSLKAVWTASNKKLTYDLAGGAFDETPTTSAKYGSSIKLPWKVTKYGYSFTGWKSVSGTVISSGGFYTVSNEKNNHLTAQYSANSYSITLKDIAGKVIRTIPVSFDSIIYGDFTYSVPGYNCLGWTTMNAPLYRNPGDEALPVVPNVTPKVSPDIYNKPNIFIGSESYISLWGNKYFLVPDIWLRPAPRKYMLGQNLTLYPVLEYQSSIYIYTGDKWHLTLPYVYVDGKWVQTLGHIYTGNSWKK